MSTHIHHQNASALGQVIEAIGALQFEVRDDGKEYLNCGDESRGDLLLDISAALERQIDRLADIDNKLCNVDESTASECSIALSEAVGTLRQLVVFQGRIQKAVGRGSHD